MPLHQGLHVVPRHKGEGAAHPCNDGPQDTGIKLFCLHQGRSAALKEWSSVWGHQVCCALYFLCLQKRARHPGCRQQAPLLAAGVDDTEVVGTKQRELMLLAVCCATCPALAVHQGLHAKRLHERTCVQITLDHCLCMACASAYPWS